MTTLRVEVGRFDNEGAKEVADWLERAPGTRPNRLWVELDPSAVAYVPLEELRVELESRGIQVDLVPWPDPPPLPWWRRVRSWPHRVYYWGRRVFLGEKEIDQFARELEKAYAPTDAIHAMATRESPMMKLFRRPEEGEDTERFILRGRGTAHRDFHPVCWRCGARFPNGPGQYTAKCPECGERWDGSEASDPPL